MRETLRFSRELSLLVHCLRQTPDPAQSEALRRHLSEPLDWTEVMALAERHRLVAHLHIALKNCAADLVPPDALEKIRRRFRTNAERNIQFTAELVRVIRALDQAGIPAMPLKGPALALQLYGGVECRQFNDLDLVVAQDQVVRTVEIIQAMGYEGPGSLVPKLNPQQQKQTLARYKDIALTKPFGARRLLLELHWRLDIPGFELQIGADLVDNRRIPSNYGTLRALPATELTLFLAYHGAFHQFFRLSWLADLLRSLESIPPSEYQTLFHQSDAFGCQRYLGLGLDVLFRLSLLPDPLSNAFQEFGKTTRVPKSYVDEVLKAIELPYEWSQHPLRYYPWMFKLGGWRAFSRTLTCKVSPKPGDEIGRGLIQSHWERWRRVIAKYITKPLFAR